MVSLHSYTAGLNDFVDKVQKESENAGCYFIETENVYKYVYKMKETVQKPGNWFPYHYHTVVSSQIKSSYDITKDKIDKEFCDETRSINVGKSGMTFLTAKGEPWNTELLDLNLREEKNGHRVFIPFFDERGNMERFYHFDSDTSSGCKYAINKIVKQLETYQHQIAKGYFTQCLDCLKLRAVTMKTADATDTIDAAGAINTTIPKSRKRKHMASSEKTLYADLEMWVNAHQTDDQMFAAGDYMCKFGLRLLPERPPGNSRKIYYGWSDNEMRHAIASVHPNCDFLFCPGLPAAAYEPLDCSSM